jgi:rhamnose transport system substrate-binding protein
MKHWKITAILLVLALALGGTASAADTAKIKIAVLVKALGNGFFEAARDGANEAAKELGNVEILYQGPSQATAEGQIEIVDSLIAQKVSAIAISANDADALVPVLKKAMKAGIKVVSFDSGVSAGGRMVNLVPSATDLIGSQQVQLISELIGGKGEIAVLSATSQATNQNAWIEVMKKTLKDPKYAGLKLDAVVYGDDSSDKSYREALGLFKTYPNLKGIISPTTVGVAATAKAIQDNGLTGKIQLTGLGLPSEMKAYIQSGVCVQMALWNPIDLGYSATQIAYALVKGTIKGAAGETVKAGRMGNIKIGANGESVMGVPFVYNKDNIEKFAAMF